MSRKHTVLASIIGFLAGALVCLLVIVFIFPVRVPRTANVYKVDESSGVTGQQLTDMALEAAGYLKTGNFQALSELVHPDYGLIFSPFATVNLSTNLCFSVKELPGLGESTEKLVWGVHTDGGEPISMTVQEYMKEFVFDRDYTAAPLIGVNYTIRTGNALENVSDSFPERASWTCAIPALRRRSTPTGPPCGLYLRSTTGSFRSPASFTPRPSFEFLPPPSANLYYYFLNKK